MRIWTRKSALIQQRTSLGKSDGVVAEARRGCCARRLRELRRRTVAGIMAKCEIHGLTTVIAEPRSALLLAYA